MQISKINKILPKLSRNALLVSLLIMDAESETFEEIAYNAGISMRELDILLDEISSKLFLENH